MTRRSSGIQAAIHPGQTAGDETHAAFGRRSIPAEPRRLRAAHRCVSVGIHPVFLPHAPCQPCASPVSALTWVPPPAVHRVASRRSSLRFGRNTPGPVLPVGAPPSRALSAVRLAPNGDGVPPPTPTRWLYAVPGQVRAPGKHGGGRVSRPLAAMPVRTPAPRIGSRSIRSPGTDCRSLSDLPYPPYLGGDGIPRHNMLWVPPMTA